MLIKKGYHSPLILLKRLTSILIYLFKNEYEFSHNIKFTNKSFFQFTGNDLFDYSKLFGFSLGRHIKNESYRFGFRMIDKQFIQISLYSYVAGKRYIEKICNIEYDINYNFKILYNKKDNMVYLKISDLDNNKIIVETFEIIKSNKIWGYKLWPYIGGNNPAPNNIEIHFK